MRWFLSIAFAALFTPLSVAYAADPYANSITYVSANVYTSSNAVGAPDGAYADFFDTGAKITLDLGEGEESDGDLTLHLYLLDHGAGYSVEFLSAENVLLATRGATIPLSTTEISVQYDGAGEYRYVRITSTTEGVWRLDAIEVPEEVVEEEPSTDTEEPAEESDEDTPSASYTAGTLIKTEDSSAVYILGSDGKRHAFTTETVFASWGLSFDDVVTVDTDAMAAYTLGANVTVRPGTYLVKLQTNPKVFAVEPGGVLRWVASEAVALQLYGADWASHVIDVSDAFWGNYTVGEDIDSAVHPDGTVLTAANGTTYYVADGSKAELGDTEVAEYRFGEVFTVTGVNNTIISQYLTTEASLLLTGVEWPY